MSATRTTDTVEACQRDLAAVSKDFWALSSADQSNPAKTWPIQQREMAICDRFRELGAEPSYPPTEPRDDAKRFVEGHEAAARVTGRTYAETLFNVTGGKEPTGEWFDERVRDFGRSFGEFYASRVRRGEVSQAFVKHMLSVGTRAMFLRLGELVDQPSAPSTGRAQ